MNTKSKFNKKVLFVLLGLSLFFSATPTGFVFAQTEMMTDTSTPDVVDSVVDNATQFPTFENNYTLLETDSTVIVNASNYGSFAQDGTNWTPSCYVGSSVLRDHFRTLTRFTLPAGSGVINDLQININANHSYPVAISQLNSGKNDYDVSVFNWNDYKTGSAWTTAGGDFGSALVSVNSITNPTSLSLGVPAGITWGSDLDLFIYETGMNSNALDNWDCSNVTLTVVYTAGGETGTTTPVNIVQNSQTYIFVFAFSILIYVLSFWVTLKA